MAEETVTNDVAFGVRVDMALLRSGNSRRWLIDELLIYGIEFTDTKLSNRCKGVNEFKDDEAKGIEKVFKKHKIEF